MRSRYDDLIRLAQRVFVCFSSQQVGEAKNVQGRARDLIFPTAEIHTLPVYNP